MAKKGSRKLQPQKQKSIRPIKVEVVEKEPAVLFDVCKLCGKKLVYLAHKRRGFCKDCFEYNAEEKGFGRPTKYRDFYPKMVNDFLDRCIKYSDVPFLQEVANMLYVDEDTVLEWSKLYPDFSGALKRLTKIQLFLQQKLGIAGLLQPATNIFLLKANHGLKETSVIENRNIVIDVQKPDYDNPEVSQS